MGVMKAFMLESHDAVANAYEVFQERHGHSADTDNPRHPTELLRYAQESMAAMGWGAPANQSEHTVEEL
jgi:hypothetical protein